MIYCILKQSNKKVNEMFTSSVMRLFSVLFVAREIIKSCCDDSYS